MSEAAKRTLSWVWWPALLGGACGLQYALTLVGFGPLAFPPTFLALALVLFFLERAIPHNDDWNRNDGQLLPDLLHTLVAMGVIQSLVIVGAVVGASKAIGPQGHWPWPMDWPLWAQVILAMVVAEFGLYWAHRLAHTVPLFWRFHAVHHSVKRLWIVNQGRFHLGDIFESLLISQPFLLLAGAPMEALLWVSAITTYIGILTHCNVEMRFGPLNLVFNTPQTHRWHHSIDRAEGDRNFGESLLIFDHVFGTYFCPKDRVAPETIGIADNMPKSFLGQVAAPFQWRRLQSRDPRQPAHDLM